jgi:hypothetical protein
MSGQVRQKFKIFKYKNKVKIRAWNVRTLSEESGNYEHFERRMVTNKMIIIGVRETKTGVRGEKTTANKETFMM